MKNFKISKLFPSGTMSGVAFFLAFYIMQGPMFPTVVVCYAMIVLALFLELRFEEAKHSKLPFMKPVKEFK